MTDALKTEALVSRADELHRKAGELRESNDDQLGAIALLDETLPLYEQAARYDRMSDTYRSLFLNYRHLYLKTGDAAFRQDAYDAMSRSVKIDVDHHLDHLISRRYFGVGEAEMLFERYEEAVTKYQAALENYTGTNTERGDYRYHLGEALYRSGQKDAGRAAMLQGLQEIKNHRSKDRSQVPDWVANVWESGCLMKLAELLRIDSPTEAKDYLAEAERIIESDPKLIIRKRQICELRTQFGQS
jgi:tetratricopeptide (TPR) repeat protein